MSTNDTSANDMGEKPEDISPEMREFYKCLKGRPGMYFCNNIYDLRTFMCGMEACRRVFFEKEKQPVIEPDGFTKFVKDFYSETRTFDSFQVIDNLEKDPKNGIAKWFELLDSYLISLGYEPIPELKPRRKMGDKQE